MKLIDLLNLPEEKEMLNKPGSIRLLGNEGYNQCLDDLTKMNQKEIDVNKLGDFVWKKMYVEMSQSFELAEAVLTYLESVKREK